MFTLDLQSRKPMSEQVFDNLRELIALGVIKSGEKLPSVRELAENLTVAPNTVQKAFRALETNGYIYTSAGLGAFAAPAEQWRNSGGLLSRAQTLLKQAVQELVHLGQTKEQVVELAEKSYREAAGNND